MKFRSFISLSTTLAFAQTATAQEITKANNADALNTGTSWIGEIVPGTGNVAVWNATVTAANTTNLGADLSWQGIKVTDPIGAVTINSGNTLTLGSAGIDASSATQNLTINANTTAGASQSWTIASGRTLLRSGNTTSFATGTTTTLAGAGTITFGGTQVLTGAGDITVNGATLYNNLQGGTQSRTGATTLNSGTIRIETSVSAFGTGALNLNGGAIGSGTATGRVYDNPVNIGGNIQVGGNSGGLTTAFIRFNGATNLGAATREISSIATGVNANFGSGAIFNGVVSNGGITKTGSGVLTLTNNTNTFAGATTIHAGSLAISRNALFNSASVTLANNGVQLFLGENGSGTHTVNNLSGVAGTSIRTDFTLSGTNTNRSLTIHQTTASEFAGTFVQGGSRSFEIVKTGAATLTLSGAGGHTLGTTISGGTLKIGGAGLLGAASYAGAITNNATLHFDSTSNQTLTGTLTGSGTLLKSNSGALTISGNATGFTGTTTMSDGVLNINNSLGGNLSATGGRLVLNGSISGNVETSLTGSLGGSGGSTGSLAMSDSSTLLLTGGAMTTGLTFNGVSLSDTVYLEFASAPEDGTVYDVVTYGAGGLNGFASLAPLARGTLSNDTANNKITFTSGAPGTRTWNTGDGVWNRFGTLTNWAENDQVYYQGDEVVFGDLTNNKTITLDGLLAPLSVSVENSANTYIFTGTGGLAGSGFFDKLGNGTLAIANANANFTGSTFIDAGLIRIIDGGNWGTGAITNNGTLEISQSTNLTLAGTISGSGALVKNGSGTLRLTAANSYMGATTLEGGILQAGANTAFGNGLLVINSGMVSSDSASTRTLANNLLLNTNPTFGDGINGGQLVFDGALDLNGATRTVTSVLGNQGVRFNGVISNGGLTKAGTGRVTLVNDANTFSGATTISEGILATSLGALAASNSVTIASGGELALGSNGTTIVNNLNGVAGSMIVSNFNIAGDGARALQINQTVDGEFAGGNTQGAGRVISLIKSGSATLNLSGTSTYSGTTTVNAGTLAVTGSLGNTAVTVENNATLSGNGNIGGSVTIKAGANHRLAVAATPAAQVTRVIGGALDLSATGDILNLAAASAPADGTYILATATGGITGVPEIVNQTGVSGTFSISGNNLVLTVVGSPFGTWAAANGLDGSPGKEAGFDDDPDVDAIANGLEWILDGDPLDGQSGSLVQTTATTAGGLTISFNRNEDSIAEATLTVEYNTNLGAVWNSATIGASSSGPDSNGVTITIDTNTTPDAVTINIPASNTSVGKLFSRIKATQP